MKTETRFRDHSRVRWVQDNQSEGTKVNWVFYLPFELFAWKLNVLERIGMWPSQITLRTQVRGQWVMTIELQTWNQLVGQGHYLALIIF